MTGEGGRVAVTLVLFAAAREAAGTPTVPLEGSTVGDVLDEACRRYGEGFATLLGTSRVWRNGDPAEPGDRLSSGDEVAVLPPVSGGAA